MTSRLTLRVSLAAFAAACATNPATGGHMLALVSESQEIAMGKEADPAIAAQMGLVDDSGLQAYVAGLGARVAAVGERPHLPWTFRVVDDPIINAFALPGGFIYVSRGILAHFNSEAELVAVLGHEVGHVTARHSVSQMSKQQLAQVGLAVTSIAAPKLAQYSSLAGQGLGLMFLKFGRDDETQSDALGLRYMRRLQYDVRQMAGVYTMLGRVSAASGGEAIPSWLSTHPAPADREQRINAAVAAIPPDSLGTTVRREEYLRRINGLVYGENPRHGYFKATQFYHPDLKFQLAFPAGWQTYNTQQAAGAVSAKKDAMLELSGSGRGSAPDSAARAFFGNQAVQGTPARVQINGLPAVAGPFTATTQDGVLQGYAAFVSHEGIVFRLLGYATQASWSGNAAAVETAIKSFARLTDPKILAVQPHRVEVVRLDRDMTVAEFLQRYPAPVPAATVALLNNVDVNGTIKRPAGKRIVGAPLP